MWRLNTSTCIHNILVVYVIYSLLYMYITLCLLRDNPGVRENLNAEFVAHGRERLTLCPIRNCCIAMEMSPLTIESCRRGL